MEGARLRQPLDPEYIQELGVLSFCFAICEWNAVYCAERLCPGSLQKLVGDELTAGEIAHKLKDLVRNMPASAERAGLSKVAARFIELLSLRNQILHAKPCTSPNGYSRLSGSKIFEIQDLRAAADSFSECSSELNRFLYGFLATYRPRLPSP